MKKRRYSLIELGNALGFSVEELIAYGADDEFTIHVIADNWPGKIADDEKSPIVVDGLVELLPTDLLKALNSTTTEVRQVKTAEGEVVALDSPRTVERGIHFVTVTEGDRLYEALNQEPSSAENDGEVPPYLDPSHEAYSYTLEAAISVWKALYVDGGFKKGLSDKAQITAWLKENRPEVSSDNARDAIARVVNPNKVGGNPTTRK